jgi:chromosome segregation ATPase
MTITGRLIIGCTLSMAFCFISPTRASSQTKPVNPPADQDQVLQKLLSEVHELRLAVQRATANSTRFQMLIERTRLQQARVDMLTRQLENIHSQAADMRSARPQLEQQIKDAEDQLDRTPEPNAHADLESRIKAAKANLTRMTQEEERLRNRETALDGQLQTEQLKLNELNNQLDVLMTELKSP